VPVGAVDLAANGVGEVLVAFPEKVEGKEGKTARLLVAGFFHDDLGGRFAAGWRFGFFGRRRDGDRASGAGLVRRGAAFGSFFFLGMRGAGGGFLLGFGRGFRRGFFLLCRRMLGGFRFAARGGGFLRGGSRNGAHFFACLEEELLLLFLGEFGARERVGIRPLPGREANLQQTLRECAVTLGDERVDRLLEQPGPLVENRGTQFRAGCRGPLRFELADAILELAPLPSTSASMTRRRP